jgi:hypothetical protein
MGVKQASKDSTGALTQRDGAEAASGLRWVSGLIAQAPLESPAHSYTAEGPQHHMEILKLKPQLNSGAADAPQSSLRQEPQRSLLVEYSSMSKSSKSKGQPSAQPEMTSTARQKEQPLLVSDFC